MAGCHLSEVYVRFDADPFKRLQPVQRERIVEVFGYRVGIVGQSLPQHSGSRHLRPFHNPTDSRHNLLGHRAVGYLIAELFLRFGRQNIIQPCQECSECESHNGIDVPS